MRPLAGSIEGPGSEGVRGCSAPIRGPGRKAWWPQCPVGHGTTGCGGRGGILCSVARGLPRAQPDAGGAPTGPRRRHRNPDDAQTLGKRFNDVLQQK